MSERRRMEFTAEEEAAAVAAAVEEGDAEVEAARRQMAAAVGAARRSILVSKAGSSEGLGVGGKGWGTITFTGSFSSGECN